MFYILKFKLYVHKALTSPFYLLSRQMVATDFEQQIYLSFPCKVYFLTTVTYKHEHTAPLLVKRATKQTLNKERYTANINFLDTKLAAQLQYIKHAILSANSILIHPLM